MLDFGQQAWLIGFEAEQIIAALRDYLLGNGGLITQRIQAHQGPAQVEQGQQVGHGPEFLPFAGAHYLAQAQAVDAGHGGDHVQGFGAGAAQGFAIHKNLGNLLSGQYFLHLGREAGIQARHVQLFKNAPERINGGWAVG